MKRLTAILPLLLLLSLWATPARAQQARVVVDEFQVSKYITDVKASLRLPSVAAGIIGPDEPYYLEAYGPAELDQPFRLGSLSKTYSALATYLLIEEGALSADAPIDRWYESAPDGVTVQDLLDHASGLSAADGFAPFTDPDGTIDDWISGATWGPRGDYEYSNLNYVILGGILEEVSGQPFDALLRSRIFEPLGMTHARASGSSDDLVTGHQYLFGFPIARPTPPISAPEMPAGGVAASPNDVARFLSVLLDDGRLDGEQVLPQKAVERTLANPGGRRYASGWGRISIAGLDVALHSGLTATFASFHAIAPERDVGVFVVTNVNTYEAGGAVAIGKGLLRTMLDATPEPVSNVEFVARLASGIVLLLVVVAMLIQLGRWAGNRFPGRMRRRWIIRFALAAVGGGGTIVGLLAYTGTPIEALFRFQPDIAAVLVGVPGALVIRQFFKGLNASARERMLDDEA